MAVLRPMEFATVKITKKLIMATAAPTASPGLVYGSVAGSAGNTHKILNQAM